MKILLILFITITCYAQEYKSEGYIDSIYENKGDVFWSLPVYSAATASKKIDYDLSEQQVINVLLNLWDEYEEENTDTLRGLRPQEMYLSSNEFLIDKKPYKELMSLRQLKDEGYKYKDLRIIYTKRITEPFEFEYIFVKQTSIEGFIEFLKKKRQNEDL